MPEYEPFGYEWEKEMMKLDKRTLVAQYRRKCIDFNNLEQSYACSGHCDPVGQQNGSAGGIIKNYNKSGQNMV